MCNNSTDNDTTDGVVLFIFFLNEPATTEIYTLSLHDALPIFVTAGSCPAWFTVRGPALELSVASDASGTSAGPLTVNQDRKSTRLNSSHSQISYAVFCLKKKKSIIT